jgi:ribosomal-protein-alanine N-acetyltransferase
VTAIHLRSAGPADLDSILAIDEACFPRPWPRASWEGELSRPFCTITLAIDERTRAPIGLSCDWCLPPSEAHLLRLATLPEHRARGAGWDLLCAVIARAQTAGCVSLVLEVGRSNADARRLYERAGFSSIGVRPQYYSVPPDDALVMVRTLALPTAP